MALEIENAAMPRRCDAASGLHAVLFDFDGSADPRRYRCGSRRITLRCARSASR